MKVFPVSPLTKENPILEEIRIKREVLAGKTKLST